MGFYDRFIVPRINDKLGSGPEADRHRRRTLASARGVTLEIGFGTGLNAAHYPRTVERVIAVEPNDSAISLAKQRIAGAPIPIEVRVGGGERLPFDEASFDTVVTTLTLCTIPDVERALGEIRRVLKPEGRYLFLEHGLADDPSVQRWQKRLNPIQMFLAGGCRFDRPIRQLVERCGFRLDEAEHFYFTGAPRVAGFTTIAAARPA